jgi:hypothetical protein
MGVQLILAHCSSIGLVVPKKTSLCITELLERDPSRKIRGLGSGRYAVVKFSKLDLVSNARFPYTPLGREQSKFRFLVMVLGKRYEFKSRCFQFRKSAMIPRVGKTGRDCVLDPARECRVSFFSIYIIPKIFYNVKKPNPGGSAIFYFWIIFEISTVVCSTEKFPKSQTL